MFDSLSEKLQGAFRKLGGKGKLSEKDIDEALRDIRMALLEADVNYKVVKSFLADIKEEAMTEEVLRSLTPSQQVIKIVNSNLVKLLGKRSSDLKLDGKMPAVILLAGVQGSGKTTSAAKLASYLKQKGRKVMLAACDMQRAAAVSQLKILGEEIGVFVYTSEGTAGDVAREALDYSRKNGYEILIVDTAGRQHVNDELMDEIVAVSETVEPSEVLFVVDCMMGQAAVDAASAFDERLSVTGFILSKADSDARGGAALSVSYITGKPIKFAGTGEKVTAFEQFHPDRMASRILGMGDVLTLIEKAERLTSAEEQKALAKKMTSNQITLEDYLDQMEQMQQMGGISEMLSALPGASKLGNLNVDERQMAHTKAIILSMTPKERQNPSIINASRRRRIAAGSGTTVTEVNRLLNGFEQAKKMMKRLSGAKGKKRFGSGFPFM
ncbi:MAG: signal recognition particle protein [Eubacteriaceae bacterium]|nr:signal recognition particle protein [Eubacteriaceae bacterium]